MNTRLARVLVIAALIVPVPGYAASTQSAKESVKESVSDAVITTSIKAENANDKDVGAKDVGAKDVSALKIKVDAEDKGVVTLGGNAGSKAEADKAVNTNASPAANQGVVTLSSNAGSKAEADKAVNTNASPAANHGDETLPAVNPGAGNRANAVNAINLPAEAGKKFDWDDANFAALPSGFNMISTVQRLTPSQFNLQVSPTPPLPGVIPMGNFISLWVWDAADKVWYFYSPTLEASGGLAAVKAYADSHFFRHFQDYDKQLDLGAGFWVNRH